MQELICQTQSLTKTLRFDDTGRLACVALQNAQTGQTVTDRAPLEFAVVYRYPGLFSKAKRFTDRDCKLVSCDSDNAQLVFTYEDEQGTNWTVTETYHVSDGRYLKKQLSLACTAPQAVIERLTLDSIDASSCKSWSCPIPNDRVYVPNYIATLGQPVYLGHFFLGAESPVSDNRIRDGRAFVDYHPGRPFGELASDGTYYAVPVVTGAARGDTMKQWRDDFLAYLDTFKRPEAFRIQFNSWYDNMLDITPENIRSSFVSMHDGLIKYGVRPLDSYVVDDGWVDYHKDAFWAFNSKFPQEFYQESELTKGFDSGFGVWFGPRGGYTDAREYGKRMQRIGYHYCRQSFDICTGDPKYIRDLCDKMADFAKKYNVNYFKIDGFAVTPCKAKDHGHPAGDKVGLAFYTFLWEEWLKGFERVRQANPNVYLNMTSYSHCSPWFLKWADAVWINNAGDMAYCGPGDNLNQCLNYRDGRYYDFQHVRQLQFPHSHIYNHEPCYGKKNYNPPLPARSHKTVVYTGPEFRKYLMWCMMRGTGFVELYYSPDMMDDEKWKINAEVLKWAEENFSILRHSEYLGGVPEKGEWCGYSAYDEAQGRGFLALRNPSEKPQTISFHLATYCGDTPHTFTLVFDDQADGGHETPAMENGDITLTLQPFEAVLYELNRAE